MDIFLGDVKHQFGLKKLIGSGRRIDGQNIFISVNSKTSFRSVKNQTILRSQ